MDSAMLRLASELAGNDPANLQIVSRQMRLVRRTPVNDTNGRFHHAANAFFCADQSLFVTVGSVNPTLTGFVLARKVAEAVVAQRVRQLLHEATNGRLHRITNT
jgi:hypothetical protein